MEVKKISGLNLIALALILFLLITSNSGLENEWHYIRNRRDVAAVMESDPITTSKAVNSYIGEEKKREKRFVFLLPLLPLFGGITATTGMAVAAAGIGTAAAVTIANQNQHLQFPVLRTSYYPTSAIHMTAKKTESMTTEKPRKGQTTDGTTVKKAPKSDEITAFRGLEEAKRKTPVKGGGGLRPRWKDNKGKIYEWDSEKGELEVYDKRGKNHEGGYDPYDYPPRRVSNPVPNRTVEP